MMRNSGLLTAAIGAIVLVAAFSTPGGAQPFERQGLLDRANNNYTAGRCLDSAMNYYALLQQFSATLNPQVKGQMRDRIAQCRRVGTAGFDAKADSGRPAGWSSVDTTPIVAPPAPAAGPGPSGQVVHMTPIVAILSDASVSPRERACRSYAETAVTHMRMREARRCDGQGLRTWSADYAFHYDWCTQRATPLAAQNETTNRARALNSCMISW